MNKLREYLIHHLFMTLFPPLHVCLVRGPGKENKKHLIYVTKQV